MKPAPGQSKRQERLGIMKQLKKANKKAKKLNAARRQRALAQGQPVQGPAPVVVADNRPQFDTVGLDDARKDIDDP